MPKDMAAKLLDSAKKMDESSVRKLIALSDSLDEANPSIRAAFLYSCAFGKPSLLEQFVQRGLSVNCRSGQYSPLIMAVRHGNYSAVDWLIDSGSDVTIRDEFEEPLLSIMFHAAMRDGKGSEDDYYATTELLLGKGRCEVNEVGKLGSPPLSLLCDFPWGKWKSPERIARLLIDCGAMVNRKDRSTNLTPMHHAATNGHIQLIWLLVENGGDIQALSAFSDSALDLAIKHRRHAVGMLLLNQIRTSDRQMIEKAASLCLQIGDSVMLQLIIDDVTKWENSEEYVQKLLKLAKPESLATPRENFSRIKLDSE